MLTPLSLVEAGRSVQKAAHFLRPELPGMFEVHGDRAWPVSLNLSAAAVLEAFHALNHWDRSVKAHLGIDRDRARNNIQGADQRICEELAVSLYQLVGGISEEARLNSVNPHPVQTTSNVLWDFHVGCQANIHQLSDEWHQSPTPDQELPYLPRRRPKP